MEGSKNPPWLFGLTVIPYGFGNAAITILMPYLLRRHGVPLDRISGVVAISLLPAAWSFVYAPLVDLGLRRKTWLLLSAAIVAALTAAAILLVSGSLTLLTVLLFLSTALAGLMSTANGTLMSALDPKLRGQAGGWYQAGNLGAGAVGGGMVIWLADHANLGVLAASSAAITFVPMLTALAIQENDRVRPAIGPVLRGMFSDVKELLRSPRTLTGLIFLLSPVGSAAIMGLISGVAPDYHASNEEVMWVTGFAGGLLSAFGSVVGGYVCGKMNRMVAYALAGGLSAVFAFYLGFAKFTPFSYGAGYTGYAIAGGFAYAVYTALVLDIVSTRQHAAGTAYAVLNSCGNLPIAYMTWVDGAGYKRWGAKGLMGVDGLANAGGALVLLLVAMWARRFWREES